MQHGLFCNMMILFLADQFTIPAGNLFDYCIWICEYIKFNNTPTALPVMQQTAYLHESTTC